jgi:endonuclease/exonuclease/phosphatase family metal-dependent hydrolase
VYAVRVLTWNLFHGRAVPPAGRSLLPEFASAIAGWRWDVALLQEVQPWWPPELARAAAAEERHVLTSRNFLLPLRRFVADRWPDAIRSKGGGANAILVRDRAISEHRTLRLRWLPERRWMHAVRLADGTWVANLHATVPRKDREQRDLAQALQTALQWAGDAPLVFGGDLNQRRPRVPGLVHAAGYHVDHVFARGLAPVDRVELLAKGTLSDHVPLAIELRPGSPDPQEAS